MDTLINNSQLIIIGGGSSIKPEVEKGLWNKLQNKFTFGLNFNYRHFLATAQITVDHDFVCKYGEELAKLPLHLAKYDTYPVFPDNLMCFKPTVKYDPTLENGVYKASLCGLFATTIGLYLNPKQIFLLGFDFGVASGTKDNDGKLITHYYQGEINHRGIGHINYYTEGERAKRDFGVFPKEKIINVGLTSNIKEFQKISYEDFYKLLEPVDLDQNKLRIEIREKLQKFHKPKEIKQGGK